MMEIIFNLFEHIVFNVQLFTSSFQDLISFFITDDQSAQSIHAFIRNSGMLWLETVANLTLACVYLAVPATIFYVLVKRKDLQESRLFLILLATFIFACGITYLVQVYGAWNNVDIFVSILKTVCALLAIATAITTWPLIHNILKLPTFSHLRETNHLLEEQVRERAKAEKELQYHKDKLELIINNRTKDLENATVKLTHEIRDRKKAQEKVEFHASLLEQVDSAIVATNLDDEIVYWNRSAEKLFGWKEKEILGKKTTDILASGKQSKQITHAHQVLQARQTWEGELKLKHKAGHDIPLHIIHSVLKDSADKKIGYAFVSFDMSTHFESEKKLQKAKEKAERSALAKQDFLSTMSHEIRTPLNVIIGMARLLLESQPKQEQMDYLKNLQFSANHLLVIINDILDFSKIEAGKIKFENISFSIQEILTGISKAFAFKAQEKNIALNINTDPALPKRVMGDQVRLTQILNNLVSNAIKFTEKGFVSIHAYVKEDKKEGLTVHFEVRDTGIGIDTTSMKQIFDSFTQADEDTTRKFGGTGLGLTICKKLIELQDGKIWVKSKESIGSTFGFELTFAKDENAAKHHMQQQQYMDKAHLQGFRLLLVEDNPSNQLVASNFLDKVGIKVDFAENGQQALELVKEKDYDIILMDLQMPVMNGFIATQEIRKLGGHFKQIPIVALTADVVLDVKERVLRSGMNDYLAKPFNPDELYMKIAKNLNLPVNQQEFHVQNKEEALSLADIVEQYSSDSHFITALLDSLRRNFATLSEHVSELAHQKDLYNLRKTVHKQMPSIKMVKNFYLSMQLDKLKQALTKEYIEDAEISYLLENIRISANDSVNYINDLSNKVAQEAKTV